MSGDPAYKARWHQKNKQRVNATRNERTAERRSFCKTLLSEFPCIACGEIDSDLIDWHHVNPEDKLYTVGMSHLSQDKWWNEVLKCVPLCALCHRKIHTNKLCLIPPKLR